MALIRRDRSSAAPQRQLVDSLGYLDVDFEDPSTQDRTLRLVEEEMLRGRARPRELEAVPELNYSDFVQRELERVSAGYEWAKIETGKVEDAEVPAGASTDEIRDKLGRLGAKIEEQSWRIGELQSLALSGAETWLAFNKRSEEMQAVFQTRLKQAQDTLEKVNQERKFAQEQVKGKLVGQERKRLALTEKNLQLEMANAVLRREVADLRRKAKEAGVTLPPIPTEVAQEMMEVEQEMMEVEQETRTVGDATGAEIKSSNGHRP